MSDQFFGVGCFSFSAKSLVTDFSRVEVEIQAGGSRWAASFGSFDHCKMEALVKFWVYGKPPVFAKRVAGGASVTRASACPLRRLSSKAGYLRGCVSETSSQFSGSQRKEQGDVHAFETEGVPNLMGYPSIALVDINLEMPFHRIAPVILPWSCASSGLAPGNLTSIRLLTCSTVAGISFLRVRRAGHYPSLGAPGDQPAARRGMDLILKYPEGCWAESRATGRGSPSRQNGCKTAAQVRCGNGKRSRRYEGEPLEA